MKLSRPAPWLILLGIGLLWWWSSTPTPPSLTPLGSDARLLAFGDSLTFGTGATPEQSYPAQLQRLTGRQVFNHGIPGELSATGLQRLPEILDEVDPHLVILCHGGNDLLRKTGKSQTADNLRRMIGLIRQRGAEVLLLGVPEPGLFLESAAYYSEVAESLQIPIEADILPQILDDKALKSDAVHPNAQGYRLMAEAIYQLLGHTGALEER